LESCLRLLQAYPLTATLASNDEIFPTFIVTRFAARRFGSGHCGNLPAAMSNLSGSLNSLSSTTVLDFYKPLVITRKRCALIEAVALADSRLGCGADRESPRWRAAGDRIHDGVDHCIACLRSDAGALSFLEC